MACAVIMAGGQGERFWPLTHARFPKYCMRVERKGSLLQMTYRRLRKVFPRNRIFVITTQSHAPIIRRQLPSLSRNQILIEPYGRNTAAAILLAASLLGKRFGPEELLAFFPADHLIKNTALFKASLRRALDAARRKDALVSLGVRPTFPAIGYGYIQNGRAAKGLADTFAVSRFHEKPSLEKAKRYVKSGRYTWNAGIFVWRAGVLIRSFHKNAPRAYRLLNLNKIRSSYGKLPRLSVDYALMERAPNRLVVKTRMDWCDVGNWDMYFKKNPPSKDFVLNRTDRPVVLFGVKGLIVIQTSQGTLICPKGRAEEAARHAQALLS